MNRPIRAMTMWRLPGDVVKVPCRGTGGTQPYYRDCATADLGKAIGEPWLEGPPN